MSTNYNDESPVVYISATGRQVFQTFIVGAVTGLLAWGLTFLLDQYVYQAVLCQGDQSKCGMSFNYAHITGTILAGAAGVFGLVRIQVFRPLLVVIASLVSLWSLVSLASVFPWYIAALSVAALYAVSYALFAWAARIRLFVIALLVLILLVVALRFMLVG